MMSPFARALFAASALTSVAPPVGGSTTLNYSLLNRMLEDTNGQFEVYHVTNLNDTGAGSFREALRGGSSNVTRIVVFDVSGAASTPLTTNGELHSDIFIGQSNLYVAGQTAPPGPDGRGFTLYGGVFVKGRSNVVLEHLVISVRNGVLATDIESGKQLTILSGAASENIVMRNLTVKNSNDVSVAYKFDNSRAYTGTRNSVVINCFAPQPSERVSASGYYGSHALSFLAAVRNYRILAVNNLFANGYNRTPWIETGSHVGWVNNYFWDFGGPSPNVHASAKQGYPVYLAIRGGDEPAVKAKKYTDLFYGTDNFAPVSWAIQKPNYIILDVIGNLYEGGPSTKIPSSNPLNVNEDGRWMISPRGALEHDPTASPVTVPDWGHFIHLNDNRVETRYKQEIADFAPQVLPGGESQIGMRTFKSDPEVVIGYDAPNTQPSNHITWRDTPRYSYPFTPMPWQEVRAHTLKYAGSHPADREPDDKRIIAEITARDHTFPDPYAPAPKDPVTTTVAAVSVPVVGTGNTGTLTGSHPLVSGYGSGNITQLEQWLHELHMEALGIPNGSPDYDPNIAGAWLASTEEAVD